MAKVRQIAIQGRWTKGYALDFHTISSEFIGHDEYGHPQFDTIRSEAGELLYRLKNKADEAVVEELVEAAALVIESWKPEIEAIVPVPPSRERSIQPNIVLGGALARRIGVPFAEDWVRKVKDVPELKDIHGYDERLSILAGVHHVDVASVHGRKILLFDDLYRSGATMNVITEALYERGGAEEVFALTITRTRVNR